MFNNEIPTKTADQRVLLVCLFVCLGRVRLPSCILLDKNSRQLRRLQGRHHMIMNLVEYVN